MRAFVQTVPIQFRANARLLDAARAKAERNGMSLSELMRTALRREVLDTSRDVMPEAAGVHPNGSLGPKAAATIQSAAMGDPGALKRLLCDRLSALDNSELPQADRMLIAAEAVVFGRLVASRGGPIEVRSFAGALCSASTLFELSGRRDLGDALMAECLSVLEQLAEAGDDVAAVASGQLLATCDLAIVEQVRALRREAPACEESA